MSEVVNLTTDECCEHLSKAIHTFVCSAGLKTFVTIHYRPYVTGREVSKEKEDIRKVFYQIANILSQIPPNSTHWATKNSTHHSNTDTRTPQQTAT